MAHQGNTDPIDCDSVSHEYEKLKHLVEIQRQIVELAKHNELIQKECEGMRLKLARRLRWKARFASWLRLGRDVAEGPNGKRSESPMPVATRTRKGRSHRSGEVTPSIDLTPPSAGRRV
jgi:hypothetical protein